MNFEKYFPVTPGDAYTNPRARRVALERKIRQRRSFAIAFACLKAVDENNHGVVGVEAVDAASSLTIRPFDSHADIELFFLDNVRCQVLAHKVLRVIDFNSVTFFEDFARLVVTDAYRKSACWPQGEYRKANSVPGCLEDMLYHLGKYVEERRPIGVSLSYQGIRNGMKAVFTGRDI